MAWLQLILETDAARAEAVSAALEAQGALAVTLGDAADDPLFEPPPGSTPLWRHTRVTALFAADADVNAALGRAEEALGFALGGWRVEPLADQDWERSWMDDFHPIRFGERLWICPSWHTPPAPEAVNILLDPGLAFGTGTHPTTAMCLRWLDAHPPQGREVLDFGCGSGVLAVAACRLGAADAWATDIDPQALQATRANAAKNGVEACVRTAAPDILPAPLQVDVLLANILARPLIDLAPALAGRVRSGGWALLSGILAEQAGTVIAAYAPWIDLRVWQQEEDWVCLSGRRR